MLSVLAILTVVFFHGIVIVYGVGRGIVSFIGVEMATQPLAGVGAAIPLLLMTVPCFGKQTGFKRRLCLLGVAMLHSLVLLAIFVSMYPRLTAFTTIPFWAASLPLLIRRLRQNPEKEAAEKAARLRQARERVAQIRSLLSGK
jgi:hypothetical protein